MAFNKRKKDSKIPFMKIIHTGIARRMSAIFAVESKADGK